MFLLIVIQELNRDIMLTGKLFFFIIPSTDVIIIWKSIEYMYIF